MKILLFILSLSTLLFSCNSHSEITDRLNEIKAIGNLDPELALNMLDSIDASNESAYVQAKFDLLKIRLCDKADILPTSDNKIKQLLSYYAESDNPEQLQEVYYYAGSVYRDLGDTPSSLSYFLKSSAIAEDSEGVCDSMMLRNTYSNLSYLYNAVQDNDNFLLYAKREYQVGKALNRITDTGLIHLADAYMRKDSVEKAMAFYDQAFDRLKNSHDQSLLAIILYGFSYLKNVEKSNQCAKLFLEAAHQDMAQMYPKELLALGQHYLLLQELDSAAYCYQHILEHTTDLESQYDAAHFLYRIYRGKGKQKMALQYSDRFVQICGELNLGKRQELAATVNNLFKYNRDKEQEHALIVENQTYQTRIKTMILGGVIILIGILLIILAYRYRQLKTIMNLREDIANISAERVCLAEDLDNKSKELKQSKATLEEKVCEIAQIRQRLKETQEETIAISAELREKEAILREKIEQNKAIISLMHQTEFEVNAEEIIQTLKKSGDGRITLSEKEWSNLYAAVDKLWPNFKEQMCDNLGTVTDQLRQFCYLARAGFSNYQIQNMANLSRVTVWRWSKKNEWLYRI